VLCFRAGRFGRSFPPLSGQQPLQPTAGAVVNVAGSSRGSDRVVLVVDDTRFIIDLEALRAYPNTMLGRSVCSVSWSQALFKMKKSLD